MKKFGAFLICCCALSVFVSAMRVDTAQARTTYLKAFKQKYVGEKKTEVQKALDAEMKRVKSCNVCHDPRHEEDEKPSKENRNPYGQLLSKQLSEKDQKDLDKALKVITKAETEKAEGAKNSFGELLKAGKVPFEYEEEEEKKDK